MDNPKDLNFEPLTYLSLQGFFSSLELTRAHGEPCDWYRCVIPRDSVVTPDTYSSAPLPSGEKMSLTSPYPFDLPVRWIVADLLSWALSHELMECVTYGHLKLFHSDRLIKDHEAWMLTPEVLQSRLQKIHYRWSQDALRGDFFDDCGKGDLEHAISSRLGEP